MTPVTSCIYTKARMCNINKCINRGFGFKFSMHSFKRKKTQKSLLRLPVLECIKSWMLKLTRHANDKLSWQCQFHQLSHMSFSLAPGPSCGPYCQALNGNLYLTIRNTWKFIHIINNPFDDIKMVKPVFSSVSFQNKLTFSVCVRWEFSLLKFHTIGCWLPSTRIVISRSNCFMSFTWILYSATAWNTMMVAWNGGDKFKLFFMCRLHFFGLKLFMVFS